MKEVQHSIADTNKFIIAMHEQMSEDEFNSWIDLMLSDDPESNAVALALLNSYAQTNISKTDFLWWKYFKSLKYESKTHKVSIRKKWI